MHEQTRIEGGWAAPLDSMVGAVLGRDPTTPCFEVPADPATASTFFLRSCTDLSAIHPCQRDKSLRFEPEGHKYFYNDAVVGCSVA